MAGRIQGSSIVSLSINGVSMNMTWRELTRQLTHYECDSATPLDLGNQCTSEISSSSTLDMFWLLMGGVLIFLMVMGLALLEIGCVHVKNTKHILMRIIMDMCIAALCIYSFGYSIAYMGENKFIGNHDAFFLQGKFFSDSGDKSINQEYNGYFYMFWILQWLFAAITTSIVSGAVSERISFLGYLIFSTFLCIFVFPVAVHWIWAEGGWASIFRKHDLLFDVGAIDFGGSGVIHMTAGLSSLIGCYFVGPRIGRFRNGAPVEMPQQSVLFQTIGTLVLWFGWYGFNAVSTGSLKGNYGDLIGKVAVTLTLSAATSGLFTVIWGRIFGDRILDPVMGNNGILAGCVAISGSGSVVEPEGAIAIGFIASIVYFCVAKLLPRVGIDDVVDAIPVHLGGGTLGAIAPGFFASGKNHRMAYGTISCGVFYTCEGNSGKQLAAQIVYALAIIAWVGSLMGMIFFLLKRFGILRVPENAEIMGLDMYQHGGYAYDDGHEKSMEMRSRNSENYVAMKSPSAHAAVNLPTLHGV